MYLNSSGYAFIYHLRTNPFRELEIFRGQLLYSPFFCRNHESSLFSSRRWSRMYNLNSHEGEIAKKIAHFDAYIYLWGKKKKKKFLSPDETPHWAFFRVKRLFVYLARAQNAKNHRMALRCFYFHRVIEFFFSIWGEEKNSIFFLYFDSDRSYKNDLFEIFSKLITVKKLIAKLRHFSAKFDILLPSWGQLLWKFGIFFVQVCFCKFTKNE